MVSFEQAPNPNLALQLGFSNSQFKLLDTDKRQPIGTVINIFSKQLSDDQKSLLSMGMPFVTNTQCVWFKGLQNGGTGHDDSLLQAHQIYQKRKEDFLWRL